MSDFLFSKIEGLEHMHGLQKLTLAGNEIEHIPVWFGKKMKALSTLNLKQNKIFSVSKIMLMVIMHEYDCQNRICFIYQIVSQGFSYPL